MELIGQWAGGHLCYYTYTDIGEYIHTRPTPCRSTNFGSNRRKFVAIIYILADVITFTLPVKGAIFDSPHSLIDVGDIFTLPFHCVAKPRKYGITIEISHICGLQFDVLAG